MAGNTQEGAGAAGGAPKEQAKKGGFGTWFGLLLLTTVFMPTTMVLGAGMLPTLIVFMFDRSNGKSFAITAGMLNLTAIVPSLYAVWTNGHTIADANEILADPLFWLTAMTASGIGWLIFLFMPPVIKAYYTILTAQRVAVLRARQAKLREEWGDDIAEGAELAMLEHKPDD